MPGSMTDGDPNFSSGESAVKPRKESTTPKRGTPPAFLREAADIYDERNRLYGDNYKQFGPSLQALFPDGMQLITPSDFNRMGVFVQVFSKLTRYAQNFNRGGHEDSLKDLAVYAMMLLELDKEANK